MPSPKAYRVWVRIRGEASPDPCPAGHAQWAFCAFRVSTALDALRRFDALAGARACDCAEGDETCSGPIREIFDRPDRWVEPLRSSRRKVRVSRRTLCFHFVGRGPRSPSAAGVE